METIDYECVVVHPQLCSVLAFAEGDRYRIPQVRVQRATRAVRELQRMFKARWGLRIIVLETWLSPDGLRACAVAELLPSEMNGFFVEVPIGRLMQSELLEHEWYCLEPFFERGPKWPCSQFGWIEEAIAWIAAATGRRFSSSSDIEQWNAGGGFALLRARSTDGELYWLKATGATNTHEFVLTRFLSEFYPAFLPKVVATRGQWNAWLAEHAGDPLPDLPNAEELVSAANRMAKLQLLSAGRTNDLLAAGAFDQRLAALRSHVDRVISFLVEAMARQTSTKAAPLSAIRLLELGEILRKACACQEELGIPDTLIHNDLNKGNILLDGKNCVFTDWCEAAIGNPFLSCERLCQLNREHAESIRNAYRECWSNRLSTKCIDDAMILCPLLAVYACLYGRGDWLNDTKEIRPNFESYARSLARHMDRAARNPILLERLCR